jgi:hypothetical protein
MSTSHGLDSFRPHSGTWCTTMKPLLEAGEFKQACVTYPCVRCSSAPRTPLRRPVAASTVALGSAGGFYHTRLQAPFDAANVFVPGPYASVAPRAEIPDVRYSLPYTWDGEITYKRET